MGRQSGGTPLRSGIVAARLEHGVSPFIGAGRRPCPARGSMSPRMVPALGASTPVGPPTGGTSLNSGTAAMRAEAVPTPPGAMSRALGGSRRRAGNRRPPAFAASADARRVRLATPWRAGEPGRGARSSLCRGSARAPEPSPGGTRDNDTAGRGILVSLA